MKSKLLTATFLILAALQVACSDDDKGLTQAQICAKDPNCWKRYTAPDQVKKIAGKGAVFGETQVAPKGADLKKVAENAQVPDKETLPASIQERADQVTKTMAAMSADPDFQLTNGTHTLLPPGTNYVPASTGSGSAGEITVARIQSAEPEVQRQPTAYAAPQADPNSVFSQPEATGAR